MGKTRTLAYIALIGTVIVWGISFISMKILLEVFSPVALAFVRYIIATTILIIAKVKTTKEKVKKEDLKLLALTGLLCTTLYFWCENNGVMRISANSSSIIIATLPIGALIADAIAYKNKISLKSMISIIISIIGVYFVVGNDTISGSTLGYVFMFGSVAAWSLYMTFTKPLFKKYSDITITTYQAAFGTLGFLPFMPFETIKFSMIDGTIILNLLFLAVLCSSVANFAYTFSLKELGVEINSLFMNLIPVVTFLFSFLILGEELNFLQLFGAALIIYSVYVISKPQNNIVEEVLEEGKLEA
jgi:drug/metabolite transporter (DMT)-like permease